MSQPTSSGQQLVRTKYHEPGQVHRALLLTLALVLGLMVILVWMVGGPISPEARAMPAASSPLAGDAVEAGIIRVATTGQDIPECGTEEDPCQTVQYAVDKAQPGDEIRVAAGTYTGVNNYGGLSQLVYLAKTLSIRGGYTTGNWTTPNAETHPTTLDAEGEGRVMVISPTITVYLEGLRFHDGDATGLGGGPAVAPGGKPTIKDAGGGLYVLTATVSISKSWIFSNTASSSTERPGCGGGLYSRGGSVTLAQSKIVSNTAGTSVYGYGGGVYVDRGSAALLHNVIISNTASLREVGYGGGLCLYGGMPPNPFPSASLLGNTLQGNYASRKSDGQGGGMYAHRYDLELLDNLIQHNAGGGPGLDSRGGGLYIYWSDAWLRGNQVLYNVASGGKEGISGGLHFCTCSSTTVILQNNTILGNVANTFGNGYGGGMSFCNTTATLDRNLIISNTATLSATAEGWGGGVWAGDMASISMRNDVIAGNHARTQGSGLSFGDEEDNPLGSRLYHVTIADNARGIGQGVHVAKSLVFLANSIIAGHTYGVWAASGEVTLDSTLWYSNEDNTYGTPIQIRSYEGDPAFVNPKNWDYHIAADSAALNRGVATEVRTDMDAQPRPWLEPDLGADEYWPDNISIRTYLPLILRQ